MYKKAVGASGAGFLPTTGLNLAGYVVVVAALMMVGFALYRFTPKRAHN